MFEPQNGSEGTRVVVYDDSRWRLDQSGHLEADQDFKFSAHGQVEVVGDIFFKQPAGLGDLFVVTFVESEELLVNLVHGHKDVLQFTGQFAEEAAMDLTVELRQAFGLDGLVQVEHGANQLFSNSLLDGHVVSRFKERLKEYLATDTAGYDNTIYL